MENPNKRCNFASSKKTSFDGTIAQSVEQRTENPCVTGSIPVGTTFFEVNNFIDGTIAQSVEQRTENPCVTGSIPVGTTKAIKAVEEIRQLFLFLGG